MKVSIIGTGIYSLALALNIAENNHDVIMWSENPNLVTNFKKTHKLSSIIDMPIPDNIKVTNNLEKTLEKTDLIIIGTTAKYVRSICLDMQNYLNKDVPICLASKGLENETCAFLSDIIEDILKNKNIAVISGPTFALDLINKELCALSLSSKSNIATTKINEALSSNHLKLRENNDLYGTQICGSIKNIFAIASGILDGLGYSESTRAFFLTESVHDLQSILGKLFCNPKTIMSFAGLGDLILTCSSPKSRNYGLGILLGKKSKKEIIENYLKENTTEGYYTLISIKELLKRKNIAAPIIDIIYEITINYQNPEILSEFLISKN